MAVYFIGTIFNKIIVFLLLPIYTANFDPASYGDNDLSMTTVTMLASLLFMEVWTPLLRFSYDEHTLEGKQKIFTNVVSLSGACFPLYIAGCVLIAFWQELPNPGWMIAYGLSLLILHIAQFEVRAIGDSKDFMISGMVSSVFQFILSAVLIYGFRVGAVAILIAPAVSNVLAAMYIEARHRFLRKVRLKDVSKAMLRDLTKYDIEFYGVNSLGNSIYYAALKAGAEMAEYLGEHERSQKWRSMEQAGCKRMDEMLFNGEYYRQVTDGDIDEYKYQYGEGCLSDQLLGQTLAHLYGLGHLFPEDHVKSAVFAIYKYNFKERMGSHKSLQRGYAYQDEPGLLLCSWPSGGRPKQPFVYSDEVWTGIEYQVAAGLIYEGFLQEGLEIVRAVRSRYDGYKRNPFNEVECGNHYARSMASWGVLNALSGLQVDLPHNSVTISPKVNQDCFSSFYSTGTEWGICRQFKDQSGALIQSFEALYHAD